MTDKELAVSVIDLVLKQRINIASLRAELMMYRDKDGHPIRWQENVRQTYVERLSAAQNAYDYEELLASIDMQDDCTFLLSTIHRYSSSWNLEPKD